MEISVGQFTTALEKASVSNINRNIEDLLNTVEYKNAGDITVSIGLTNDELYFSIYDIILSASFNARHSKYDELVSILGLMLKYLSSAIDNNNFNSLFKLLHLNVYLKIPLVLLLDKARDRKPNEAFLQKIVAILSQFRFDIKVMPGVPKYELELKERGDKAYANNDVYGYYGFIQAVENGAGSNVPQLVKGLWSFFLDFDTVKFEAYLQSLNSSITNIIVLSSLRIDQLIKVGLEYTSADKWFLFEVLRQISMKKSNDKHCDDISLIINRLYLIDVPFYKQSISFFNNKEIYNCGLGKQMVGLSEKDIRTIVDDCFVIDRYNHSSTVKDMLLQYFKLNATDSKYNFFVQLVFKKWEKYLRGKISDKDFYVSDIVETDYYNYVLEHYKVNEKSEDIVEKIKDLLYKVIWIDSEWHSTSSSQQTMFFIYYSKLYALSTAYKEKQVDDKDINELASQFKANKILKNRYFESDYSWKTFLQNVSTLNAPL